ncbi:MAG TPA: hypothetical protein VJZ77_04550 [Blastocatellia bacterium]|nr:hypothetical protein [Blastocatellia bacterium]
MVTIEGDYFVVSNYFTKRRVPVAHLDSVTENFSLRPPSLSLYFEPPTTFGKHVRIIPPAQGLFIFDRKSFDEVAAFLRSVVNDRQRL